MSEEVEIDKLEKLIDRCNECKFATCENCEINWTEIQAIKGLLDLYKKLKEIEKTHKEENGKLRVELEQEKEKNKTKIDIKDIEFSNFIKERYVSKDKIKEKLELLKDILKAKEKDENIYKQIPIEYLKGAIEQLEELLEEK